MEDVKRILVTGGGAPGAPSILKAIALSTEKIELYSCDIQPITAGKLLTDHYFTVPSGDHPDFTDKLLAECIKNKISVILPITTKELIPLSVAKNTFAKNGIKVLVSEPGHLAIANDKGKLYHHLKNNSIDVPQFGVANTYDEFSKLSQQFSIKNNLYIIKPCVGNGSRGFRIVDNCIDENDLLFNHKPNATYISEQKLNTILSEDDFPPILVSEYMPGVEYTVDCLVQNGIIKLIIPRRRDKMNNGISVAGVIDKNEDVIGYCRQILNCLKLDGPIGIQVKYSENNKPLIVEINPRIQGTTIACIGAGINIPLLAVAQNSTSLQIEDIPIKWGTKFIRHYEEIYY